jgi:hypothetical protein
MIAQAESTATTAILTAFQFVGGVGAAVPVFRRFRYGCWLRSLLAVSPIPEAVIIDILWEENVN